MSAVLFMLSKFSFFRFLSVADLGEAYTGTIFLNSFNFRVALSS